MAGRLQKLLSQPYPEEESLIAHLKAAVGVGFLIFAILYFLRPLGIDQVQPHVLRHSAYAGLVTFMVSFLFDMLVFHGLKIARDQPSWTFKKWLISAFALMFLIAVGNFGLMIGLYDLPVRWLYFGQALAATLLIGMIPTFLIGAYRMGKALGHNRLLAREINTTQLALTKESKPILIPDQRSKEPFQVYSDQLLYVESMQNYVCLRFMQNGTAQQKRVRITMRSLAQLFEGTSIVRCHRSFFVNRDKVVDITGNAQGLKLQLAELPEQIIPVSRRYLSEFRPE